MILLSQLTFSIEWIIQLKVLISLYLTIYHLQDLKVFKCSENKIEYPCARI